MICPMLNTCHFPVFPIDDWKTKKERNIMKNRTISGLRKKSRFRCFYLEKNLLFIKVISMTYFIYTYIERFLFPQTHFFQTFEKKCLTMNPRVYIITMLWAFSSAGRASAWRAEGHRFEPCSAHHSKHKISQESTFLGFFIKKLEQYSSGWRERSWKPSEGL